MKASRRLSFESHKVFSLFARYPSRQRQLGHTDHGVHRCADFVTDVSQKLALGAGRFFRALSGCFEVSRVHSQRIFRLLPFDELADLAADRAHHLQQPMVGLLDLVAEEFEDA